MTPLINLLAAQAEVPEVIDRIPSGFSYFVLPFTIGVAFMFCWIGVGTIRLFAAMPREDRKIGRAHV